MQPSKKKLVLAYPPYSTATSPPAGVCFLKGFVQRSVPEWLVKVLDLNLLAHQQLLAHLDQQLCPPGARLSERLMAQTLLARAAQTFSGQNDQEFYGRPDRCLLYSSIWGQEFHARLANPEPLDKAFRGATPMPAQVGHFAELILREQPAMIGLSICYTQQLSMARCLAQELKKRSRTPILAGGTFFNSGGEEFLAAHAGLFDYILAGEGENSLAAFLSSRLGPEQVPGMICWREGKVHSTPPALEEDLDRLGQPDYSDLDLNAYYSPRPVLPVMTSRGCYWRRCAFCAHYKSAGQTYRRRSIGRILEELAGHVARGIHHFALIDEMISPAHFAELAEAITASGLKLHYYAMAKPVKQFDRPLLSKIHQSGCRFILWGVESGCQRVLDLMDKGTTVPQIEQVLLDAHAAGLKNHVFIMFGFPTETRAELQLTLDLLARHKATIAQVHRGLFQLERNSPIFDKPQAYSITRIQPAATPGLYSFDCSAGMTRQDVRQAFSENIPFLRSFASCRLELGDFWFRDHLLLIYSHRDGTDRPPAR